MWKESPVARALGVRLPIVAAPMAGGPTTPQLVAAASAAGALGVLGGGYSSPDAIREDIAAVRALTDRPFGVNLLVPQPYEVSEAQVAGAMEALAPYLADVGLSPDAPTSSQYSPSFADQLDVLLSERVPVFSFAFGLPDAAALETLRAAGIVTSGTATTVAEAQALASAGVEVICAQGAEAGGHHGSFLQPTAAETAPGLVALLPQVCDAVDVPVIAAGGICDGRAIVAAMALGAAGVQLGTAFLRCPEAGTSTAYRLALATAGETSTVFTSAFSGKPARGIRNRMTVELASTALPPYPVMNALTRALRRRAAELQRSDYLSLWAGQAVAMTDEAPAAEVVARLERETDAALSGLAGLRS